MAFSEVHEGSAWETLRARQSFLRGLTEAGPPFSTEQASNRDHDPTSQ
jgi:hypothetical protein